jgi:hypothetical protein
MIRKSGPLVTTMEIAPGYNVLLLIANGERPRPSQGWPIILESNTPKKSQEIQHICGVSAALAALTRIRETLQGLSI